VVEHTAVPRAKCPWVPGRDVWYADEVPRQPSTCEVRALPYSTLPYARMRRGRSAALPGGVLHACMHRSAAASWAGGSAAAEESGCSSRAAELGRPQKQGGPRRATRKADSAPACKGAWRWHVETR
jgi:hypothetical protein